MVLPTVDVNALTQSQDGRGTIQPVAPHPWPSLAVFQGFVSLLLALVPSQASPPQYWCLPRNNDRPWPTVPFLAELSPVGIKTVPGSFVHVLMPNRCPNVRDSHQTPDPLPYTSSGRAVVYLLLRRTKLEFTPFTARNGMMCSLTSRS